ncbi:MAG: sel1 repeat family protein [Deltaproteobacteria bacterium]|nr:sel1 repeat family protein [Deltaproteobacteria bacterium]
MVKNEKDVGVPNLKDEVKFTVRLDDVPESNCMDAFLRDHLVDAFERLRNDPETYFNHGNAFFYGKPFGEDAISFGIEPRVVPIRVRGDFYFKPKLYYTSELGFKQNFDVALFWYQKSGNRGFAEAQYMAGIIFFYGYGVEADTTEALRWLRMAAAQGHTLAQYMVDFVYDPDGQVKEDKAEVVKLYQLQANQPSPIFYYKLAMIYLRGEWAERDYTLARQWLRKAAAQKHGLACYELALIYHEGLGIKRSLTKSLKWFREALDLRKFFAFPMIRKIEMELSDLETKSDEAL